MDDHAPGVWVGGVVNAPAEISFSSSRGSDSEHAVRPILLRTPLADADGESRDIEKADDLFWA